MLSYATRKSTTDEKPKPIIFFSVFSKSNKTLNNQIMFRSNKSKPKLSSRKPKPKLKKKCSDLQLGSSSDKDPDIRNFFTPSSNGLEKGTGSTEGTDRQAQLSLRSHDSTKASHATTNLKTDVPGSKLNSTTGDSNLCIKEGTGLRPRIKEDRARESEVVTQEHSIKVGRSSQLMSTSSVAVEQSK